MLSFNIPRVQSVLVMASFLVPLEIVGIQDQSPISREVYGMKTSLSICCIKVSQFMFTIWSEIKYLATTSPRNLTVIFQFIDYLQLCLKCRRHFVKTSFTALTHLLSPPPLRCHCQKLLFGRNDFLSFEKERQREKNCEAVLMRQVSS